MKLNSPPMLSETFNIILSASYQYKSLHMGLIAYAQKHPLNAFADVASRIRGLNFGLSLHLHQFFAYASSEGSDESAHIYADSSEHSLHDNAISTNITCAGLYWHLLVKRV